MTISRDELRAIEAAVVRGWPALEQRPIQGWLARWSSGGSVRANSVATVAFDRHGNVDDALSAVTAFYGAHGGVAKINVTGTSLPDGLEQMLEARGWRSSGEHVTMAKRLERPGDAGLAAGFDVSCADGPDVDWLAVYLQGLSADRRGIARRLVEGVPAPRLFFSAKRDGLTIGSGLSVIDGPLASVQCMATAAEARRQGAASAILAAIEAHARARGVARIYLQTDAENAAAIALYERSGFTVVDRYHSRIAPG